jgi:hypothetical protein
LRHAIRKTLCPILAVFSLALAGSPDAWGWSCKTHVFIAEEAGIANPRAACFPDLSRKENDGLLGPFHWHNAAPDAVVSPDYIDRYPVSAGVYLREGSLPASPVKIRVPHPAGVLYWKICDLYQAMRASGGWEYEYYLAAIAHYVGDLSQPLHNFPSGTMPAADGKSYPEAGLWARKAHLDFDAALDPYLPLREAADKAVAADASAPEITSLNDLKLRISKVANASIALAAVCYAEKRTLTKNEALRQVSMSVALLKAIAAGKGNR